MGQLYLHPRLHVRFLALLSVAVAVFLIAWVLSYTLLPDGILRGRTASAALAGQEAAPSLALEWLRIAGLNLVIGTLCVVGVNLVRGDSLPLGYLSPIVWAVMYAICLGTDSFAIPLPAGRLLPTFAVFGRSGPYEIAAFILAATTTYNVSRFRLRGCWPRQVLERTSAGQFSREQWLGLAAAVALLLTAAGVEAAQIVARSA